MSKTYISANTDGGCTVTTGDQITVCCSMGNAAEMIGLLHDEIERLKSIVEDRNLAIAVFQDVIEGLKRDGAIADKLYLERLDKQADKIERLKLWVSDCQSGMYINCVYCGHRYGPREDTPVAMADVLKQHIEQCPKHPLSEAQRKVARLESTRDQALEILSDSPELNMANYNENEVSDLNDAAINAYQILGGDKQVHKTAEAAKG